MDWRAVKLVVFDVDGTLYSQSCLRLRMGRDLIWHTMMNLETRSALVLRQYRKIRELLATNETVGFDQTAFDQTASACRISSAEAKAIVSEWIEQRPIVYLRSCRYEGVADLFHNLRRNGKNIAVLSDYPATLKLRALELDAEFIVCAGDPEVEVLKPHPKGLERVISLAGATPATTLMIGDRIERDGESAKRLGVKALIKSNKSISGWDTFSAYNDAVFRQLNEINSK